jgi:lambda family phage portal protein
MIHLYSSDRVNQTRGVSWFAAVLMTMRMLDGYEEAELVASRIAAAKMGWFQVRPEAYNEVTVDPKQKPLTMETAPGAIDQIPPGWEFVGWDPQHPTSAFPFMVKQILRKGAAGLTTNYNAWTGDLESVNYSSMKGGTWLMNDTWRTIQRRMVSRWRRPFFNFWLQNALLTGTVKLPSRDWRLYRSCRHNPRGWPLLEPWEEIRSASLAVKSGMGTRTGYLAQQGLEFEDVIETLAREKQIAAEAGVPIDIVDASMFAQNNPSQEAAPAAK